ncbi:hypothetical protein [Micromonospora sp. CPCC 206061]|uniref:hypothetical protein n=1 Tax=Micromonospora sp. CPCC 206061 TaxID=3122410 RepID=UPI002FF25A7C
MRWSVLVSPLHRVAADGGLEWAATVSFAYVVPDQAPASRELPSVADVLAAFRAARCPGTAWFAVEDLDAAAWLPPCKRGGQLLGNGIRVR